MKEKKKQMIWERKKPWRDERKWTALLWLKLRLGFCSGKREIEESGTLIWILSRTIFIATNLILAGASHFGSRERTYRGTLAWISLLAGNRLVFTKLQSWGIWIPSLVIFLMVKWISYLLVEMNVLSSHYYYFFTFSTITV